MSNHIRLIWQMELLIHPKHVQRIFLKYRAQRIKQNLQKNHPAVLECFRVGAADREYQFWERHPLSLELRTDKIYRPKLDYIHWNPVRAGVCKLPEEYKYSSALFYETDIDDWGFLSHRRD
jgi:REP element-mobilizing transposase RayT